MLIIGLTGGIATGKSSVSNLLTSRYSIPVVDADVLARQVVEPGTRALSRIVAAFGPDILTAQGTLNRSKLGQIVFNDPVRRKVLNKIVHPAVHRAMLWVLFKLWITGHKCCILDVPLLIEGGLWKWVAKVVVVYCPPDIQLQRLMRRDGSSTEDASARLNSQMPIEKKVELADEIIDNSGSVPELEARVSSFAARINHETGWSWMISWFCPPFALVSGSLYLGRKFWRTFTRR